jgi:hypothetical protein
MTEGQGFLFAFIVGTASGYGLRWLQSWLMEWAEEQEAGWGREERR